MKTIRTVIAEDETPARQWLRALCARHRDVEIVGECASAGEVSQRLRGAPTDLLLLDIHLGPHVGFRVLEGVPNAAVPLIVVTTAYDQYAVRAFERNAVDYLLKPVREERFAMALDRVRRRLQNGITSEMRAEIQAALEPLMSLHFGRPARASPRLIAERDAVLHVVDPREIELIESSGNYVQLHTPSGEYSVRSTMQAMEDALSSYLFLRLNRSIIVNIELVARIERNADCGHVFVMKNGRRIKVGRSYRQQIAELIRSQGLLTHAVSSATHSF